MILDCSSNESTEISNPVSYLKKPHFLYLLSEVLNSKVIGNDKEKIENFIRHFAWFS